MKIKKVIVNVTARDISKGKKRDCSSCPIARALRRRPGFKFADVGKHRAVILRRSGGGYGSVAELPQIARRFIEAFDGDPGHDSRDCRPIKFELEFSFATRYILDE